MAVHDIRSGLQTNLAFLASIASDTTTNGTIFDTANFELGLMFQVMITAFTDGTYNFTIEEDDVIGFSSPTAVTGDKLIGTLAGLELTAATAAGGVLPTIGVISNKRFVRLNVVSTGTTSGATVAALITQKAEVSPVI